jgi:hypothetical protein
VNLRAGSGIAAWLALVAPAAACSSAGGAGPGSAGPGSAGNAADDAQNAAADGAAGAPADGDAEPSDAGTAQSAAARADAGLALSDDFESAAAGGPPNPALWTIEHQDCSGTGTLAVDDTQAHSGRHSVRVDGGGGYCDHVFFANATAIGTLGGEVYARFFVRLGDALGAGHTAFLAMKDEEDGGQDVRMGGQDMILMYNRQSDDATLPVLSPTGVSYSVAIAPATWTCVELHIDEAAGTIDTWVDGAEVRGLVENGSPVPDVSTQWLAHPWMPSLADFRLGWESYAGQAMTLWFDDVALAPRRIGCGT